MNNIVAFANNDLATIAWTYGQRLPGCLGFAIYRTDENSGKETPLPAFAVFPGEQPKPGRTTADDPVQKFYWKNLYAKRGATYRYKIVPMKGAPGQLQPMGLPVLISNPVTLTPHLAGVDAYFNRGILATQKVARALTKGDPHKSPAKGALLKRIAKAGDRLRLDLAGDMLDALLGFLARASSGGSIYAALYELADAELLEALTGLKDRLRIVLSNALVDKRDRATGKKKTIDSNGESRNALNGSQADKYDRLFNKGQIGHNKFLVHVDKNGKAQAVLFGSTNWTPTGLCAQTNNTVIVRSPTLAQRYLDYWKKLRHDTRGSHGDPRALQAKALRGWDAKSLRIDLNGHVEVTSWFAPNTKTTRSSNAKSEGVPPDMKEVFGLISRAKNAILFLAFDPGTPSIIEAIADARKANRQLFVRGCMTAADRAGNFYIRLHGLMPAPRKKGGPPPKQDPRVISTKGVRDLFNSLWRNELVSAGHAVVHDKIVVIDPLSPDCVVITGSHNLGHRASYNNDENLGIFRGHRGLAEAYMTHVLDVYDHFAWRWLIQEKGPKAAQTSLDPADSWQDKYFDAEGKPKSAQLRFWLSASPQ